MDEGNAVHHPGMGWIWLGEGCPLCRIYQILEKQALSGILGPAMMEPSIREETNRLASAPVTWGCWPAGGKAPFALPASNAGRGAAPGN